MGNQWQKERPKSRKKTGSGAAPFRGFVTHTLTKEDKAEYARYEIVEDFVENILPTLLSDGYKVSFSLDGRSDAYLASITTKDEATLNAGLVLTARSGFSPMQAGLRAAFLHEYVFEKVWPEPLGKESYVDEWADDTD